MDNTTIQKRLKIIDDLTAELNVLKEQYTDALESDPQYQKAQEKMEELKQEQKVQKEEVATKVLEKDSHRFMKQQIKEKADDIKQNKEILSVELIEYYKATGALEIEDAEGHVKKMKFSVTLVS